MMSFTFDFFRKTSQFYKTRRVVFTIFNREKKGAFKGKRIAYVYILFLVILKYSELIH